MKISLCLSVLGMFATILAYAQDGQLSIDPNKEDMKISMTDYIDVQHRQVIDYLDSIKEHIDPNMEFTDEDVVIVRRMKIVSKTVPLDYNTQVKDYIDKYTSQNWRPYMNRLLGLSQHYFKIYDQVFEEMNVPNELKYLSLVESSLNPHLISTAGAVGPWQFMYATAKYYDLDMNAQIDERKDAYAASYAVSKYLTEAYHQFDDWLLAIASYNCGRGCVQRAIQRSGMTAPTFWELSPYLPRETRNYVPKFIAMTYVMSTAEANGIEAVETELDLDFKLLMVDKQIDLNHVAKAINLTLDELKKFNPAYKRNYIQGSVDKPKRLLLPLTESQNDSLLYTALNTPSSFPGLVADENVLLAQTGDVKVYKGRQGDTQTSVSRRFGVSVQNLRAWNGLTAQSSVVGKTLVVEKPLDSKLAQHVNSAKKNTASPANRIVYYVVKRGDSLDRIANKHKGTTVEKLKADNNLKSSLIRPGMKLKIRTNG